MFDIKYDSSILEIFSSNSILHYRFIGTQIPKVNPIRKGFRKKIYYDVIASYLDKLDEIMKYRCNYEDIKKIGIALYGQLIPKDLEEILVKDGSTLTIVSENNEIPWELLHDGQEFWGTKYSMGRNVVWNDDLKYKQHGQNKNKVCLIIANPTEDLPESIKETTDLMKYLKSKGIKCRFLSGSSVTIEEILSELSSYKYDFIHYSGHIDKSPQTGEYSFVLAQDNYFPVNSIKSIDFGNPFVFLNACISGRIEVLKNEDEMQSELEGAVIPFISAGACGVIGSMWKISDEGARKFSEYLYSDFIDGEPIGKALLNTRKNLMESRDPLQNVWPSFVYYGHPGLCLVNDDEKEKNFDELKQSSNLFSEEGFLDDELISDSFLISLENMLNYLGNRKISTTHLFLGMLLNDKSSFVSILKSNNIDYCSIKTYLLECVAQNNISPNKIAITKITKDNFSKSTLEILMRSYKNSQKLGKKLDDVAIAQVILSCFCSITTILEKFKFDFAKILKKIS